MFQLARNAANDHFRKWKKEMPLEDAGDMPDQEPAPDDSLMHHEKSALLTKALALLSAEKREVLVLSKVSGAEVRRDWHHPQLPCRDRQGKSRTGH